MVLIGGCRFVGLTQILHGLILCSFTWHFKESHRSCDKIEIRDRRYYGKGENEPQPIETIHESKVKSSEIRKDYIP